MKKLYVLLSSLVLIFVMQSVSFGADEAQVEAKKPHLACPKCGRVCTCSPKPDKYSNYPESEEYKVYKEYMRQVGQQRKAEQN